MTHLDILFFPKYFYKYVFKRIKTLLNKKIFFSIMGLFCQVTCIAVCFVLMIYGLIIRCLTSHVACGTMLRQKYLEITVVCGVGKVA